MINPREIPSFKEIIDKGTVIYEKIKDKYEPEHKGEYLAIEVDSEQEYLGVNGGEAMEKAKLAHPDKFFFLTKIGFTPAEILAASLVGRS